MYICLGPLRCGQLAGSHHQDTHQLPHDCRELRSSASPWQLVVEGEASFIPALDTNPKWTTHASFIPSFLYPDKNTAQKGQQGPADIRLLGYEEIW